MQGTGSVGASRGGLALLVVLGLIGLIVPAGCRAPEFPPPGSASELVDRLDALRRQAAADAGLELPVSFSAAATAIQRTPVSLLAAGFEGAEPIDMTHPVFVVEWDDGRQLVIDPGLAEADCPGFGAPAEWLGAEPIACAGKADPWLQRIEPARVRSVIFSHLHLDHVSGVREICRLCGPDCALPVALSALQTASSETHEESGRALLDAEDVAACIERIELGDGATDDGAPRPVSEALPGVYFVPLPGHTPGSQLVVVLRREGDGVRADVVAGDVVNYAPAICADGHPKPVWYRWLIVREDESRQAWNRSLLRELDARGFGVHVSHDLDAERSDGRLCPAAASRAARRNA